MRGKAELDNEISLRDNVPHGVKCVMENLPVKCIALCTPSSQRRIISIIGKIDAGACRLAPCEIAEVLNVIRIGDVETDCLFLEIVATRKRIKSMI